MSPFEYISTHLYTKLKPSKIQGIGVFAIKDIPENTNPFEYWKGETGLYPIKEEDLNTLPSEIYLHIKDMFTYSPYFPEDKTTYVKLTNGCHWIYTNPYYFVNSGFEKSNIDNDTLLTTRKIFKGEEILGNYGRYQRFPEKELI